jgi:threonine dehydratase
MELPVVFSDILDARANILNKAHRTPIISSKSMNSILGCEIYFKCENLQKVGAFKYRGACNAVSYLSESEKSRGVATASSGNHAQALALSARENGVKATIVMPSSSPRVKLDAVAGYGAEIILSEPNVQDREAKVEALVKERNCVYIHPSDDRRVIAGQGTCVCELKEEIEELDYIITPLGGGGLLSGASIAAKALYPSIKVIGAEPAGADDAFRSIQNGRIEASINPNTIGDGLLTQLGPNTFQIISALVDEIIRVEDAQAIESLKLFWQRCKLIIEPSSAFAIAAIMAKPEIFRGKRVGVILSGGNADIAKMANYFA